RLVLAEDRIDGAGGAAVGRADVARKMNSGDEAGEGQVPGPERTIVVEAAFERAPVKGVRRVLEVGQCAGERARRDAGIFVIVLELDLPRGVNSAAEHWPARLGIRDELVEV